MSVVIRMKRTGRKNLPCYRISVTDVRSPRDGKTIERLGLYDPLAKQPERQVTLDVERAKHWLRVGAKPSETVRSIFKRHGVLEGQPEPRVRRRPGRNKATATKARRLKAQAERSERKGARRAERKAAARSAAGAAEAKS